MRNQAVMGAKKANANNGKLVNKPDWERLKFKSKLISSPVAGLSKS
jgi:hypothetical protein